MNCNQAQDLFIDLIYEETDSETRKALEKHLEHCTDCASAYESLKQVRRMCSSLEDPQPSNIVINRILAQAREEAGNARPLWGFGWMRVLSMVCVVVIAGGIVLFQSESTWFQRSMPAALIDTAPAEPSINRSTTIQETRPSSPLSAASAPASTLARTLEPASPPVGIITTGTSTSVHPQASQITSGQIQVSINMHRSSSTPTTTLPVFGSRGNSGMKARSPAAGNHAVNTGAFTIETYFSSNRSLDMSTPDRIPSEMIQSETIQPETIQIVTDPRPGPAGTPHIRMASRSIRLESTQEKTAAPSPLNPNQKDLDIDHHLEKGRAAFEAGLFSQAIYHLEHSVHLMTSSHPQMPHALNHLAQAYENHGDFVKAKSLYQEIVSKYPHFSEIAEQRLRTLAAE